jgi:SPOR domain
MAGKDQGEDSNWDEAEDVIEPTEQLPLDEEGDRLPWLESAEDEDEDGEYASDSGRLLMFALAGLLSLLAIVGAIWWLNRDDAGTQIADGSVISAPTEPYKVAPKDPGGKTFDGTGDSSFAVSEGQTRPGTLAKGEAPAPAAVASAAPVAAPKAGAAAPAAPATSGGARGGVGVQVGAYSSEASAKAGWGRLTAAHGEILKGVNHRVVQGQADIGTVYRLQAVASDAAAAQALCGRLKSAGVACQVK